MQLVFEQIRTGGDRNFGYLLADRDAKQAVLIDPSYTPETLVARAAEQHLRVTYIINTHGHQDHINGNDKAVELTGAPVAGHPALPTPVDVPLRDGQELTVGAVRLRFMHVPGHAADHLVVYEPSYELLITGDLLFVGKIGGTSTEVDARTEWDSLQRLLKAVPDSATVWPGHDYGVRPSSTVGIERKTNPFLLCPDENAFVRLKAEWPEFKKQHGLK
ncbi:MAG: MBL fold hydrolase [Acidobacteria bacterium RIFCSPLOWO2_12_FULL_65_11]|nr:MAG: MBL fold hydrolase [Acidobacteria bacterium RIFCSPLOWO2_02_FULL_64_15]OFW31772.1 MAG: MBL fold hydrolase [Acidobacteria bacterium RIFCSPLOWO2_12_FULL_65_11]